LQYNDVSVLENFHIASAYKVLNMPECNILENLTPVEKKEFRRLFVEIILSTDLTKHWDLTSRFKARVSLQLDEDC
jgi:cAMP-specific phosphodiesterase 4